MNSLNQGIVRIFEGKKVVLNVATRGRITVKTRSTHANFRCDTAGVIKPTNIRE